MNDERRLQTYCAQRNVAYVAAVKGETVERRHVRQLSLTDRLTDRQRRRLRRKGAGL